MRFVNITASPHPSGNRIDLTWGHPEPDQFPGVRIVRRQGSHPVLPEPTVPREGVVVADTSPTSAEQATVEVRADGRYAVTDTNLKGETVYYYALFPYTGNHPDPDYVIDRHNRTAALATGTYNTAGQLADLLPALYHRYDTVLAKPHAVAPEDRQKGQLRRFLDLPGGQLDLLYSFARAMLDFHNIEKVDGQLLPLLADWIGWQIDYRLELDVQRNDLRNAPHWYTTIGLIPTVEATVKRVVGWESRTKEFVHNVFLTNRPERLNLWLRERDEAGAWSTPTAPFSLDFAYEGRPSAVRDDDGTVWLFYHTLRKDQWDIWYKTFPQGPQEQGWTPSQPLTSRGPIDKYPTAVVQAGTLRVFWSSYIEAQQRWEIHSRSRTNGQWSPIASFSELAPFADPEAARRQPWAVVDEEEQLWLFWLERVGTQWQLQYNRHDGSAWALAVAASFPLAGAGDLRVEDDLFVLFHPSDTGQRLWAFWTRKEPTAPGQTRWRIVYRTKASLNPNAQDWSSIRPLPAGALDSHDREPAAIVDANGNVELFWSSNRAGSWSIWRATVDRTTHVWETPEPLTDNPYSQRTPLPIDNASDTLLVYHSNESVMYTSSVYGATETVDARYAGSTTVDTRNTDKLALRGQFEDFQTYTYDTGQQGQRTNQDWYARDTVGLYLSPDTADQSVITQNQNLLRNALRQFLPAQIRPVFIIEPEE